MNPNRHNHRSPRLALPLLLALLGAGCSLLPTRPAPPDTFQPALKALGIERCGEPVSCTPVVGANRVVEGRVFAPGLASQPGELLLCRQPGTEPRWSEQEQRVVCVVLTIELRR